MRPTRPPPRPHPGCRRIRSSIDGDPSFSIHLSLCSTDFHQLPRSYEEIRLLHVHRLVVVAFFQPTAHADPCRSPRVRTLNVLPLPASIPLRSRLDFGRRVPWHAHPIGPACPRLHFRSVLQHASGFFPTWPRGARAWASHDGDPCMQLPSARGCYQLAPQRTFTSNPVPMPGTPTRAFGPPPPAAYGVDSACHPASDCHKEVDGKMRPIPTQMSCRKFCSAIFARVLTAVHRRSTSSEMPSGSAKS